MRLTPKARIEPVDLARERWPFIEALICRACHGEGATPLPSLAPMRDHERDGRDHCGHFCRDKAPCSAARIQLGCLPGSEEWPGKSLRAGSIATAALLTAVAASPRPTEMSFTLPG